MNGRTISRIGKGAGYLASAVGMVWAAMVLLLSGPLVDGVVISGLLVAVTLAAGYAVRTERLVAVWAFAVVFGVIAIVAFVPFVVYVWVALYVLAGVLLTVGVALNRSDTT